MADQTTIQTTNQALKRTPLYDLHVALGGKMVPFAGYEMPVQFPAGVLKEHLHTRAAASLFDVSHMGQVRITGAKVAEALERLVPGDIAGLAVGAMRYTMFTNDTGGIIDDLMVTRIEGGLQLVINAARRREDTDHLMANLAAKCILEPLMERALIAVQGPQAAAALERIAPGVGKLAFMHGAVLSVGGKPAYVTRSGYTGEDGFEISVAAEDAEAVAKALLDQGEVEPAGLGARDSLRLEAGLCLYGHDIDETTTPIEASLAWTIAKRRRAEGGFAGADVILKQLAEGPARRRVGLLPEGKAPAREGTAIVAKDGRALGAVTSGGFGPSVGGPVAMGYVAADAAKVGTEVDLVVRGTPRPARVAKLPFVEPRYHRGT